MQYDEEKLNYKLESLQIRGNALKEEHSKIIKDIHDAKEKGYSLDLLREQLRANLLSIKEVQLEIRQAYKEYKGLK